MDTMMFQKNMERSRAILNLFSHVLLIGFKQVRYLQIFKFCFLKSTVFVKIMMVTPGDIQQIGKRLDRMQVDKLEGYSSNQVDL